MSQNKSPKQLIIENDVLRYKKNKLASSLALLGLVFNCLYFLLLYAMRTPEFKTYTIGFSVVLTLVVLLVIFLSSEGVKGYNKKFSIALLVVAAFQILRIFGYPLKGLRENLFVDLSAQKTIGYFGIVPNGHSEPLFTVLLVWLIASAACLIASAVIGWIYAVRLEKFQKQIDNGEVDIMATIAELDAEDAQSATVKEEQ